MFAIYCVFLAVVTSLQQPTTIQVIPIQTTTVSMPPPPGIDVSKEFKYIYFDVFQVFKFDVRCRILNWCQGAFIRTTVVVVFSWLCQWSVWRELCFIAHAMWIKKLDLNLWFACFGKSTRCHSVTVFRVKSWPTTMVKFITLKLFGVSTPDYHLDTNLKCFLIWNVNALQKTQI